MREAGSSAQLLRDRGPLIWFLVNFAAAKAAIYLVPLGIAAFASSTVYGAIEFGWAVALMAAAMLTGAQFGGINQRYLVSRDRVVNDELALWTALCCASALTMWGLAIALELPVFWQVALASCGVGVIHNVWSTTARMRGARVMTAWADGTATFVGGALFASLVVLGQSSAMRELGAGYAALAGAGALTATGLFLRTRQPHLRVRIGRSWQLGLPMLANAILATWLGVYGRILIGLFAAEAVSAYGLMFRVAGLALAVHQLAVTALFAQIYSARTRAADRMLAPFLLVVAAILGTLALAAPVVVPMIPIAALDEGGIIQFTAIFPVVALQVFFWIAFAMLQMRINRSGLAARAFGPMLLVTLAGTCMTVLLGWLSGGDLAVMCWAIGAQSAALFWVEWFVLSKARLPHARLGWIALVGGTALAAIAVVNQMVRIGF